MRQNAVQENGAVKCLICAPGFYIMHSMNSGSEEFFDKPMVL